MSRNRRPIAALAVSIVLFLTALGHVASAAERICSINRVVAEKGAVRVFFFVSSGTLFGESKQLGRFEVKGRTVRWPSGKTDAGLLLRKGQEATLISGVESYCVIGFGEVDGHVGINAVASDTPPDAPHQSANDFIRAQ